MMQHLTNENLIDYMHRALLPEEDAVVHAHLEQCAQCRAQFDAEAQLTEVLRRYAAEQERELPGSVKAEIWNRVRAAKPAGIWTRVWAIYAVPAAAAIALGLYFASPLLNSNGAPSIEAAYYLQDHAALNTTVPFSDRGSAMPVTLDSTAMSQATEQTAVNVEAASYTANADQ